jgi:hypothetical protein
MDQNPAPRRRRSIGWLIPALVLVIIAAGWSAFWFYAADRARETIAGWIEREARGGRVYACGSQALGGFPFRIEFHCNLASAVLEKTRPPLKLSATHIHAAVQVYQPTLVIAEIEAPLKVVGPDQQMTANWSLAQVSLRGTPRNPQRVSFTAEKFSLDRSGTGKPDRVFTAEKGQLHGRLASGTVRDDPVIDVAASLKAATATSWHPALAQPFDFEGDTRLIGLRNFQPKSWSERFKEIQLSNGRIEVRNARLKQGDMLAIATGNLKLTKQGYLEGDLVVTATGIEKLLPALGRDMLAQQGGSRSQRLGAALNLLDQMAPGAIAGAVSLLGEQVELEGRRATKMPLKFKDGVATLGPVKLGQTPPLF